MSKRQPSHPGLSEIAEYNRGLEATLARRLKMTLGLYKLVESLAELAAVFLGFYAISQGADPLLTFMAVAVIVGGWKVVEFLAVYADDIGTLAEAVSEQGTGDDNDD